MFKYGLIGAMMLAVACGLVAYLRFSSTQRQAMAEDTPINPTPTPTGTDAQAPRTITTVELFNMTLLEAERGNPQAMMNMGAFYERGIGTSRNFTKALEWYEKAAQAGVPAALMFSGNFYEVGIGAAVDTRRAVGYFNAAANQDLPDALYKMALLFSNGVPNILARDETRAFTYLERAFAAKHGAAGNDLAVVYLQGGLGQPKDPQKALLTFLQSAELGNLDAAKNAAVVYVGGEGLQANLGEALRWYLVCQKAGYALPDLEAQIEKLKAQVAPQVAAQADRTATQWLENKRAELEAARQAAQNAARNPAATDNTSAVQ